jgi:hypothetical protein
MIDAQSSALAALLASPEGCRKLAGHNLPGNQPPTTSRPEGALEHSPGTLWRGLARRRATKAARHPQGPFKIKNPSQNARKTLKVNKGKLRVFDTPPGGPTFIFHIHRPGNAKNFIFNHFTSVPTVQSISFLPPKNLQFMSDFQQRQFINKNQRNLVSYLTQHATRAFLTLFPAFLSLLPHEHHSLQR